MATVQAIQPTFDDISRATGQADLLIPPLIVGDWLASILLGVLFALIASYFGRYGLRDLRPNAIAVTCLTGMYLATAGTILARELRIGWNGDYALVLLNNRPLSKVSNLLEILPLGTVQLLLCYRWFGITRKRRTAIAFAVWICIVDTYAIIINFLPSGLLPSFDGSPTGGFESTLDWEECFLWLNVANEITLATLLTLALRRGHNTGVSPRADSLIRRVLTMTVANSAIVTVCGIAAGISTHIHRERSILLFVFGIINIPLYGVCLLCNLLLRDRFRAGLSITNGSNALRELRTGSTDETDKTHRLGPLKGAASPSEKTSAADPAGSYELYAPTNTLAPPPEESTAGDAPGRAV